MYKIMLADDEGVALDALHPLVGVGNVVHGDLLAVGEVVVPVQRQRDDLVVLRNGVGAHLRLWIAHVVVDILQCRLVGRSEDGYRGGLEASGGIHRDKVELVVDDKRLATRP